MIARENKQFVALEYPTGLTCTRTVYEIKLRVHVRLRFFLFPPFSSSVVFAFIELRTSIKLDEEALLTFFCAKWVFVLPQMIGNGR